jgi:hypothetical protein
MKYKCEEIGFVHAWDDITSNVFYATIPVSYPPRKRQCLNCGKVETQVIKQEEVKVWE